ncbi:hypothetical protein C3Y87_11115 [Carbonactinospora thermoautotrophica]|uniref:WXG100-like domain-containing protein n=1 Tax=Carbonactinospora thermoautotrophica TaxID=1469144 RepID=UPI0022706708|nr:hypothetical protein [Carbonactinospora thermoautotrophica]MCX9191956.1 hypothetical protein [Carbonactinospora thermoautotrophica]
MSILLPGELVTVLDLLGFTWPQADEDKLEDCARAWRDFANEVEHVLADADRVARAVVAENHGASIAAFEDYWPRLGGGSGQLCEAADAARLVAEVLEGFAEAVRWAKRLVLAQLVACAASLAAGPLSAVAQQGFRLAIRKALDELLERVVTSLLPRLKSEVGEVFERILREPRRHLEDFADNLRASLQGMGGPPLALAGVGDVPAGPLARRLDDLTHVEGGPGGPNIMAMLSGTLEAEAGLRCSASQPGSVTPPPTTTPRPSLTRIRTRRGRSLSTTRWSSRSRNAIRAWSATPSCIPWKTSAAFPKGRSITAFT